MVPNIVTKFRVKIVETRGSSEVIGRGDWGDWGGTGPTRPTGATKTLWTTSDVMSDELLTSDDPGRETV